MHPSLQGEGRDGLRGPSTTLSQRLRPPERGKGRSCVWESPESLERSRGEHAVGRGFGCHRNRGTKGIRKWTPWGRRVTLGSGKPPFSGSRKPCRCAKTRLLPHKSFHLLWAGWILGPCPSPPCCRVTQPRQPPALQSPPASQSPPSRSSTVGPHPRRVTESDAWGWAAGGRSAGPCGALVSSQGCGPLT